MDGPHRRSPADLNTAEGGEESVQALLRNGPEYAFFQALRLLRHTVREQQTQSEGTMEDRIRVRPNLSLAFPAADIDRIEQSRDDAGEPVYRITANFLGLYGGPSPLPTFYTEDLLAEAAQDETVSRDFLDIINQRLYDLLYQGWLKYRQYLQVAEECHPAHLERLYCLLGLGSEASRRGTDSGVPAYSLLRYIGLFTQFPRSAAGLTTLLTDALNGVSLSVVQCIPRQAAIPESQRLRMGMTGNRLGLDSHVGQMIEDRMGRFRIRVGPLDSDRFYQFTPGNPAHATLAALTALFITEPLACEVELILAAGQAETICLGNPRRARLGVNSWVFSEPSLGEVRTRFEMHHL
jgi:type VI secretion system protein ImpH